MCGGCLVVSIKCGIVLHSIVYWKHILTCICICTELVCVRTYTLCTYVCT